MITPFRHPLATYPAGTVLGYRRNGKPIYAIAGGSDEGDGASGSSGQPAAATPPPAGPPAGDQGGGPSGASGDTTDWKAEARKWEARAKENKGATDELTKLREQAMTDQEKAVAAAEKSGRTAAAAEYAVRLAAASFEAAVARAGLDLGDASDLIDTSRFVADGEVDTDAIKTAVKKLAKLAPARGPGRSGADHGAGGETPATLDKQIAEASARRDFATVIRLKRQRAAQT
ncbi:hypothetical protein OOK31_25535 [Streptomyces sp. NBC_00249]|uniref:hypothetical protein n=1 Tax=Streptomyces sp. NBC_00249 TaxID=2975690 RepID=UPI00225236EA|nr:hypothetical protein [Streptomyces sp. NBC_00249]MCX5197220.1 hypothetical protein [Streptomyces sp. NBC_00249]